MKLADAHLHLFRRGYADRYGDAWARTHERELYETFRRVHGIERGLVVGYEGLPQYEGNNRDLARWAKQHPWIAPLAYLPVEPSPAVAELDAWLRRGFVGIAVYAVSEEAADRFSRWHPEVVGWLNEHRLIVSLNARPDVLEKLAPFLGQLGGCRVLISHLGLPGAYAVPPSDKEVLAKLRPLRALARSNHVGVKLSGLYAISQPSHDYPHTSAMPFLRAAYDEFGPRRLYWGSDFSPALEHISFAQTIDPVLRLGWPAAEVCDIMGGNLLRLLGAGSDRAR